MGWLVQATDYRKLNEPPRPRLQRNGTIYLMARRPLLCQGGDFAFPAGCPTRPCPADDLWVMISGTGGVAAPSKKWSRSLLAQTGWSFQMRCFETHSPHAFRGLTTPSAPTLVAFGIIFLMARPPLLCKEGNPYGVNPYESAFPKLQLYWQVNDLYRECSVSVPASGSLHSFDCVQTAKPPFRAERTWPS